ncbi:MAG: hypothetical protein SFY68_09020 [Candidatus Sumerlaeia bacterium]|nr:hypothetical protein [Candidatus Sumerlaeia bacterium]
MSPTKSPILALICVLQLFLMWGAPLLHAQEPPQSITWMTDLEKGKQTMLWQNKPGMVYFYTRTAHPAYQMQEITFKDPEVIASLGNFINIAINITDNPQLVQSLGVYRIPTVMFLDSAGREIDRMVGYKSPFDFNAHSERMLTAVRNFRGFGKNDSLKFFETTAVDIRIQRENTNPFTLYYPDPEKKQQAVYLLGDFNNWRTREIPMTWHEGNWFVNIFLETNRVYEYKYISQNDEYFDDPYNPFKTISGIGTVNNVMVSGNARTNPVIDGTSVLFFYYNPEAKKVEVAGDFSNWQPLPIYQNPNDSNFWGGKFTFQRGYYQYKLIVDGNWMNDPENYNIVVTEGDGFYNNAFTVK